MTSRHAVSLKVSEDGKGRPVGGTAGVLVPPTYLRITGTI